jgi:hypothetical protein
MPSSKTVVATIAVAALLVTAGCAGSLDGTAAASQPAGESTIQVSATGQAQAEPDQAILRVAVVATADDASTVREQLANNVSTMRAALRQAGVADDQVRTAGFDIRQQYRTPDDRDRPPRFEGTHAFEITLSNVSRAGEIIDVAVENGANRVDTVTFTLSDDRRRALREQALRRAMDNARADAETIASSANLSITGVRTVSTSDTSFGPVAERVTTAQAADAGTVIESGPVTVAADVSVAYNATA